MTIYNLASGDPLKYEDVLRQPVYNIIETHAVASEYAKFQRRLHAVIERKSKITTKSRRK